MPRRITLTLMRHRPNHANFRILKPLKTLRPGYEALPTEIHTSVMYRWILLGGKNGYPANTNLFTPTGPIKAPYINWVTTGAGTLI